MSKLNFNKRLALYMTSVFGSMACFYFLFIWALLPMLPQLAPYQDKILYISAGVIQLIALPLLAVGQNIQSQESDKRIEKVLAHISKDNDRIIKILKGKK